MDSLQEAQRLMGIVQKRVDEQEVIGGEAVIQMLSLHTSLASAEHLAGVTQALRQIVESTDRQNEILESIARSLAVIEAK